MPALPVVRAFALEARLVLQHINDLLAHPNHLFASIEPVTDEERFALHKETPSASAVLEGEGLPDPSKRPFLCAVIQRLLLIARTLAFNVNLATRATGLLVNPGAGELEDLVIGADATVSASEPATIGTLMELGTVGIDWHRESSSSPSLVLLPTSHANFHPLSLLSLLPSQVTSPPAHLPPPKPPPLRTPSSPPPTSTFRPSHLTASCPAPETSSRLYRCSPSPNLDLRQNSRPPTSADWRTQQEGVEGRWID